MKKLLKPYIFLLLFGFILMVSCFWVDNNTDSLFCQFLEKVQIPFLICFGIYIIILLSTLLVSVDYSAYWKTVRYHFIDWLELWTVRLKHKTESDSLLDLLSPRVVPDSEYISILKEAIDHPDVRNVALSGPYCSGKSSIIKTFQKVYPRYECLNISLACFHQSGNYVTPSSRIIPFEGKLPQFISPLMELEYSILQQFFYHVKASDIPDSRFARIRNQRGKIFFLVISTISFILPLLYFMQGDFILELLKYVEIHDNKMLNIVMGVFLVLSFTILLYVLFSILSKMNQGKIKISEYELELKQNIGCSIFNQYLDELIYLFQRTKYSVVFLEDLDRHDELDIFSNLRELNILLNQSKDIHRKIVFVYAMKDELFNSMQDRNKFFDCVIPVIPHFNSLNSTMHIIEKVREDDLQGVEYNFLVDVAPFITDYRILQTVIMEYKLSYKLLPKDLNGNKLFALILYKQASHKRFATILDGYSVLDEICKDKYQIVQAKMQDLLVSLKNSRDINEKESINRKMMNIEHNSSLEICLEDSKLLQKYSQLSDDALLLFLVKRGYIDDTYYRYITPVSDGVLSADDNAFLIEIKMDTAINEHEFDRKVDSPEMIIRCLIDKDYKTDKILNLSLIHYLFQHRQQYLNQCKIVLEKLSRGGLIIIKYFFSHLCRYGMSDGMVYRLIIKYSDLWSSQIIKNVTDSVELDFYFKTLLSTLSSYLLKVMNKNSELTNYFNNSDYEIILENMEKAKAREILYVLHPKFKNLIEEDADFFEIVVKGNFYELSGRNIEKILQHYHKWHLEQDQHALYSAVLRSGIEELIMYVDQEINMFVSENVLNNQNTCEEQEALLRLLNNKSLSLDLKEELIQKQLEPLPNLRALMFVEVQLLCILYDKVVPTIENLNTYYIDSGLEKLDLTLINFINNNASRLVQNIHLNRYAIQLKHYNVVSGILRSNDVNEEVVSALLSNSIYESYWKNNFEELSSIALNSLIEEKRIPFSIDVFKHLLEKSNDVKKALLRNYSRDIVLSLNQFKFSIDDLLTLLSMEKNTRNRRIIEDCLLLEMDKGDLRENRKKIKNYLDANGDVRIPRIRRKLSEPIILYHDSSIENSLDDEDIRVIRHPISISTHKK